MGLDMYLHMLHRPNGQEEEAIQGAMGNFYASLQGIQGVRFTAAYWRKANQIHKWFVDNIQSGKDDCGRYYVSRDDLKKLIAVCKEVQKDYTKIAKLLPPSSGYFFGSQEIDSGYWHDILITIEQLEAALLAAGESDYFEYSSSW